MDLSQISIAVGNTRQGHLCGTVFNPRSGAASFYDTLSGSTGGAARECAESISPAAVPTWMFLVLGIIVIIAGFIIKHSPAKQTVAVNAAPAPVQTSVGDKLVELDSLRQRVLITEVEFEAKRKDLLDCM